MGYIEEIVNFFINGGLLLVLKLVLFVFLIILSLWFDWLLILLNVLIKVLVYKDIVFVCNVEVLVYNE